MTSILGVQTIKAPFFWCLHRMTPFFRRNLTLNAPYFRSLVGTCMSLSYLSAPRGLVSPPGLKLASVDSSKLTNLMLVHYHANNKSLKLL